MITADAALVNAISGDDFEYAYVVDLPVDLHYTNHGTDLTVSGTTYQSNGLLVKFADVSRNPDLNLGTYSLELSNVDRTIAQAYASGSYRGLAGTISMVILVDGVIQGSPLVLYRGTLDSFSVRESGGSASLMLKLTSHWASYNQKSGRYSSDTLQQDIHTGDRFFKYAHIEQSNLGWGKR